MSLFGDLGKTALRLRGKGLTLSRSHFNIGAVFKVSSYRTVKYCILAHSLTPGMDISLFCFYLGCKCTMNTLQLNLFTLYIHVCMKSEIVTLKPLAYKNNSEIMHSILGNAICNANCFGL